MQGILNNLLQLPKLGATGILEICLLAFGVYYIVKSIKDTRAWILLKGLLVIFLLYAVAYLLGMEVIVAIFQSTLLFLGIIVILILEPEIRRFIEQIGTNNINISTLKLFQFFKDKQKDYTVKKLISDNTIQEIVKGCSIMSKAKTGVLIVIENNIPLDEYIETGIKVDAEITSQLLINIFEKNTPLHDGAVIVRHNRVESATCYLPLSNNKIINKDLGTRHRAGIGVTEASDSFVIIVSEETGAISVAYKGKLKHGLDREGLTEELKKIQDQYSLKIEQKRSKKWTDDLNIKVSVLLGVTVLWFLIMGAVNPIVSTTFRNVPIELVNTSSIAEVGKTYSITSGDTVNVTVSDRKDVIDKLTVDDIEVKADFSKLSVVNAIALEASVIDNSEAEIKLSNSVMTVAVEDLVSSEYTIETQALGSVDDDYYLAGIELNHSTLLVSGAKSKVNKIGRVVAEVDVEGLTANKTVDIVPVFYDKNGDILKSSDFEYNGDGLQAEVRLYNTKRVPIKLDYTLADESLKYIISDIRLENTDILVAGSEEALEACTELTIKATIDINMNDVAKSQYIKNLDVTSSLPEGIYVNDEYSKINMLVEFKDFNIKTFTLSRGEIALEGNTTKHIDDKEYKISFVSLKDDLSNLDIDDIQPYINVNNIYSETSELKFKNETISNKISNGDIKVYGDTLIKLIN